ncbi:MAG: DUF3622 domain-containing protein [Candidatus Sedimenticola sp. (ex Thyasira tokunagai)]
MAKSKKYDIRVVEAKGSWSAEIIRKVTSKETVVSKSQDGFATEAEAREWGEKELTSFMKSLGERNKRRNERREK